MARKDARAPIVEIIVRRGALKRFDTFKRKTSELPVALKWDRRVAPTAQPPKQRKIDRRGQPPFTWQVADFVVVEKGPKRTASQERVRKRKKVKKKT